MTARGDAPLGRGQGATRPRPPVPLAALDLDALRAGHSARVLVRGEPFSLHPRRRGRAVYVYAERRRNYRLFRGRAVYVYAERRRNYRLFSKYCGRADCIRRRDIRQACLAVGARLWLW